MREIKSIKTGASLPVGEQPYLPRFIEYSDQEKEASPLSDCPWLPGVLPEPVGDLTGALLHAGYVRRDLAGDRWSGGEGSSRKNGECFTRRAA
jgi:hypothetical protein